MTKPDVSLTKDDGAWTLVFIRELTQPPARVWTALTDPAELDQWSPFTAHAALTTPGETTLTMVDGDERTDLPATVHQADEPTILDYTWGDDRLRWELEPTPTGTRLTLRHTLADPEMKAMVAAGWHLCTDVLEHLLDGHPIGVIRGKDALDHGWDDLRATYEKSLS